MKIYIACLASYNSGTLYGKWIEPTSDADEIREAIAGVLEGSPAPDAKEWAIHDYDAFPNMGENPSVESIAEVVELFEGNSDFDDSEIFAMLEETGGDAHGVWCLIENYIGTFDNFREYSDEVADASFLGEVPVVVADYFDYDSFARDLQMGYRTIEVGGGVMVFAY